MVKYRNIIVLDIVISFLVVIFCFCVVYLYRERTIYLDFEYVTSIDVSEKSFEDQPFPWMSIIDEKYNPFWNKEYLVNKYGKEILDYEDFSDTDKYSYIVTFGRKLNLIAYKHCEARTKYFGIIPNQYIGKVSLSDNIENSKIYVYRIKKINLVHDEYGTDYYL